MKGKLLFEVDCPEPGGVVRRQVFQALLDTETLVTYYNRLARFETLFNEHIKNDLPSFISVFLNQDKEGRLSSSSLVWEVDNIGILYMTDIRPGYEAVAHFTFWDGRLRGRAPLLRAACKFAMEVFGFHRVVAELPMYIKPAIFKLVEDAGFKKEGRRRETVLYKGDWFDSNLYSLLASEV